uniref:Uncharacterized protein n=1 Tax=Tanacetum cinerariifolium TaxID=118510 RepID=A0A6L2LD36_TANCI|nr:hypothetical protein [Tanacetum cinerariifolium]
MTSSSPPSTPTTATIPPPPASQQQRRLFPAAAATVIGCGWRIGHHRRGEVYKTSDLLPIFRAWGCPPPNHHRGGGRTTVQPPQPHLVVLGCDGATPSEASGWSTV